MAKSQEDLLGLSTPLDYAHHDVQERHEFGAALAIPDPPSDLLLEGTSTTGGSLAAARADHQHVMRTPWSTWTPTIGGTGWALGNGTIWHARYYRYERNVNQVWIHYEILIGWGSTSTFGSGGLTITSPVNSIDFIHEDTFSPALGSAIFHNTGTGRHPGGCIKGNNNNILTPTAFRVSGSFVIHDVIDLSTPFAWANGDFLGMAGDYRVS